jgi:hypothetical protein
LKAFLDFLNGLFLNAHFTFDSRQPLFPCEDLLSIVIQHPLNLLYLVVKAQFEFRPLNFTQKFLNTSETILWPGNYFHASAAFMYPKSQKSEGANS